LRRPAFLIIPALFGVLGFKGATQYIFSIGIATAGKPLVDKRLKIGGERLAA